MAGTDSRGPRHGNADTTAFGLPEGSMPRKPGYVKTVTEPQDEAMGDHRRPSEDRDIPREPLAERIARNRQKEVRDWNRSEVTFTNSHWTPIYVAYSWWDEACEIDCGDGWNVLGWIALAPAETQTWPNPSGRGRIYYYAEATDGTMYSGSFHNLVMDVQFQICGCNYVHIPTGQTPWYPVGFDELELTRWSGVTFF